ncbi:MAG: alanine--tRNA ligase [bacterium]|nr:alanine--tRNA ligase [bacterium]
MHSDEIRKRFLRFFESRGHRIIPSASLVPVNDPSVLFTTAGMHPLVPYLLGREHPEGRRLTNVQKCVRMQDIEEVGDATHDTFFEMLGNWSLGDYFKKEAIEWSYQLLTSREEGFGLDPERLYVTVFAGDKNAPQDRESKKLWLGQGIAENRIYYRGADANWWPAVKDPVKDRWTGPTGPDTEMFYDVTAAGLGNLSHNDFMVAEKNQEVVEIWNDVFMAYEKKDGQIVRELESKNVDTGAGLERLAMLLQKKDSIFETDLFETIMPIVERLTDSTKSERIVADHMRTVVFMIADGVVPSNTERGYVLRRLIRRAIFHLKDKILQPEDAKAFASSVALKYKESYPELAARVSEIESVILEEADKFKKTLGLGLRELEKLSGGTMSGKDAFILFSTYGFPLEMTVEITRERGVAVDEAGFYEHFAKHQELSRVGAEKKFKGGLADTTAMAVKYHTATHLLHQALRMVLGSHVLQRGSNITSERLRFDFTHGAKMTEDEKKRTEDIVNGKIREGLPVQCVVMPREKAEETGALHLFEEKYGDSVNVYYIGEKLEGAFSKEYCGGPHVNNTQELGHFKITKEEAVSSGVRRVKAVLS